MEDDLHKSIESPKLVLSLFAIFAALALALCLLGLYGVMSYLVSQSTPENGNPRGSRCYPSPGALQRSGIWLSKGHRRLGGRFNIIPEREYTGLGKEGKDGKLATILLALSIIVLLIASINISALFSSRFEDRRRELAIRIALGATRLRLARQLLIEGLVLSLFSAGICLLIGIWAVDAVALILPKLPFSLDLGLRTDHRVIAFTLFIALFATLAFGLGPTLRFSRSELSSAMTDSRRGGSVAGSLFGRSLVITGQPPSWGSSADWPLCSPRLACTASSPTLLNRGPGKSEFAWRSGHSHGRS